MPLDKAYVKSFLTFIKGVNEVLAYDLITLWNFLTRGGSVNSAPRKPFYVSDFGAY